MLRAVGIDLWTLYGLGVYSAKMSWVGNSPAVQGLGFCAFAAKGAGSIPGWGTKILQAVQPQKKKKKVFTDQISCRSVCGRDETVQRMVSRG